LLINQYASSCIFCINQYFVLGNLLFKHQLSISITAYYAWHNDKKEKKRLCRNFCVESLILPIKPVCALFACLNAVGWQIQLNSNNQEISRQFEFNIICAIRKVF